MICVGDCRRIGGMMNRAKRTTVRRCRRLLRMREARL